MHGPVNLRYVYTVQNRKKRFVARQKFKGKSCRISMGKLKICISLKVTWFHNIAFSRHQLQRFLLCAMYLNNTQRAHCCVSMATMVTADAPQRFAIGTLPILLDSFVVRPRNKILSRVTNVLEPLSITRHDKYAAKVCDFVRNDRRADEEAERFYSSCHDHWREHLWIRSFFSLRP